MTEGVVYAFGFRAEAPHLIGSRLLDGNVSKIEYIDSTFDKGLSPLFEPGDMYAGRAVKSEHVPTMVEWSSKRYPPPDTFLSEVIFVSDAFKDIVERHEPGVHQFFPVEVVYKDGSFARQMYFFNICNRLDTMDRDRATAELRNGIMWDPRTGDFAFSLEKLGSAHVWKDKHVHPGRFLSSIVADELTSQGLTGISLHPYPAV